MKKIILFLVFCFGYNNGYSQHDYDNQGILFSNSQAITIGNSNVQGYYTDSSARALEVYSSSNSFFHLKSGSNNSIFFTCSEQWGNYILAPNIKPFDIMVGYSSNPQIRLQTNGSVSIGTTQFTSDFKLAVGGKIIAEELKVQLQSQWPDYVFESDYELPSLNDVEKQIQENGHLAGVPSACEVEENGFEVGEMNRLLLEKVEELTLYIIELNKKLAQQQEKLEELENKVQQ